MKLELDLDGFASMDSQLLAMAGAYLGFAVQAVSEQYKQVGQTAIKTDTTTGSLSTARPAA